VTAPQPVAGGQAPAPAAPAAAVTPTGVVSRASTPAARAALARAARQQRPVVARFHVRRASLLRIHVRELAPLCRAIGAYRFHAKKGANRLRLPAQIGRTKLGAGTYALVGRTLLGRRVFHVVADVTRTKRRLLAHVVRRRAVCAAASPEGALLSAAAPSATTTTPTATASSPSGQRSASAPPRGTFTPPAAGAAHDNSPLVRAVTLQNAPEPLRPLLYALLALSIVLLATAAAPQRALPVGAAASFVAERRAWLAAAGVWLLAVVAALTVLT
jgi:hypothetical protein